MPEDIKREERDWEIEERSEKSVPDPLSDGDVKETDQSSSMVIGRLPDPPEPPHEQTESTEDND